MAAVWQKCSYSAIRRRYIPPERPPLVEQKTLEFRTRGRGTLDITAEVARAVAGSRIRKGLCSVFLQHTSASRPTAMGTWQGLYLFEHRHAGRARSVVVTVMGER